MKYILLLCLLFAVTAICVTATACAVIGALEMVKELWKLFCRFLKWCVLKLRKYCRWVAREINEEKRQVERQETMEED